MSSRDSCTTPLTGLNLLRALLRLLIGLLSEEAKELLLTLGLAFDRGALCPARGVASKSRRGLFVGR